MENIEYAKYAEFQKKQQELISMVSKATGVTKELNMENQSGILKKLSDKISRDSFKVQIVGTFKNGKSTFINSLLGEEVLPAYALPCTAVVNEVKWGQEKKAIVYFRDPLPEKLPSGIPDKALQHMNAHGMKNIPPIEIDYSEIEDYAVISLGHGKEEIAYESPYEKIDIFWPLPILKNGVEIIDSPGLNECATRTRVTMNYISKADAILFVLDATRILSADEMRVIEHTLREQGFTDPFIIVNKFDAIRNREREPMKTYVRDRLEDFTTNDFFFVSALNALDGKIDGDEDLLKASGMIEFENSLADYLTKEKGKVKLAQPTIELKRIINEEVLFKTIPMQRSALATSLDAIKDKYERAKPRLDALETKKQQVKTSLELRIEQTKPELKRIYTKNYLELSESIPVWIDEYDIQTKLGAIPKKQDIQNAVKEISTYIHEKIEENQASWRKNVLESVLNEKSESIFGTIESDIQKFHEEIDKISLDIMGKEYQVSNAPTWQRVAGAIGGMALGDVGLAMSAGTFGFSKEFAKSAALEIGAISALMLFNMFNPVTIGLTIIGLWLYNIGKSASIATKKVKEQVKEETLKQLSEKSDENANAFCDGICAKYQKMADGIVDSLDIEVNETKKQVDAIIAEMEKGKENIAKRQKFLDKCEEDIKKLSLDLDDFTKDILEG